MFNTTEDEYHNLGLNISGYCNGDVNARMPCAPNEFELVRKYEADNNIPADHSLTNWMDKL